MIPVEFSWAAAIYVTASISAVVIVWLFFDRVKAFPNRSLSERSVWQCSICTFYYIDSKNSDISVCPRCGSYNKKHPANPEKEVKG